MYWDHKRGRMRGLNRGFEVGSRSFVIEWRTKPADWDSNLQNFGLLVDSFWTPRVTTRKPF